MIIKQPFCADISHWKEVSDFSLISPRPFLMLTKATEGKTITDSKFVPFMDGMKQAGIKRGCYHFNRKILSPLDQADFFCKTIQSHIDDETLLALDVEEGGELASGLQTWFNAVRSAYPRNRLLLYSRRDILEPMFMTAAQKEYFKKIDVWAAGYPINPDPFDYVPSVYIPDPSRFGPVALWQYSAHGAIEGIVGDVDLNWISPAYYQLLGGEILPPEPNGDTMVEQYKVIWTDGCNQRPQPSTNNTPAGILPYGAVFEINNHFTPLGKTKEQEDWGQLVQGGNWVALIYNSQVRAVLIPSPVPVDDPDYILAHWADGRTKKYIPE